MYLQCAIDARLRVLSLMGAMSGPNHADVAVRADSTDQLPNLSFLQAVHMLSPSPTLKVMFHLTLMFLLTCLYALL